MNLLRIFLAAMGGFAAYFVLGGLISAPPAMRAEYQKYPQVYRNMEGIKSAMPLGMVAMLVSIVALAMIYSLLYRGGSGAAEGARFGALIGIFAIGAFVVHNYVNLNIGWKGTAIQAVAYFVEWTVVGIVIGLIYKPAH